MDARKSDGRSPCRYRQVVGAYFEEDEKIVFCDWATICLSVTSKVASSDWNPITGAKPKV